MAQPKKQSSRTRSGNRRSHLALKAKNLSLCPKCKQKKLPGFVCPNCNEYKNQKIGK